jgi:hypothetical protein
MPPVSKSRLSVYRKPDSPSALRWNSTLESVISSAKFAVAEKHFWKKRRLLKGVSTPADSLPLTVVWMFLLGQYTEFYSIPFHSDIFHLYSSQVPQF